MTVHVAPAQWPDPGDSIGDGRVVLGFVPVFEGGEGEYAWGRSLFLWRGGFVIARAIFQDDTGRWVCESGMYFRNNLAEAVKVWSDVVTWADWE